MNSDFDYIDHLMTTDGFMTPQVKRVMTMLNERSIIKSNIVGKERTRNDSRMKKLRMSKLTGSPETMRWLFKEPIVKIEDSLTFEQVANLYRDGLPLGLCTSNIIFTR